MWTTIARADRDARDVHYDQLEGVIDQLRRTDEAEVAVVCKENDRGEWYVSTRSKGAVDVGRACVDLGGAGTAPPPRSPWAASPPASSTGCARRCACPATPTTDD